MSSQSAVCVLERESEREKGGPTDKSFFCRHHSLLSQFTSPAAVYRGIALLALSSPSACSLIRFYPLAPSLYSLSLSCLFQYVKPNYTVSSKTVKFPIHKTVLAIFLLRSMKKTIFFVIDFGFRCFTICSVNVATETWEMNWDSSVGSQTCKKLNITVSPNCIFKFSWRREARSDTRNHWKCFSYLLHT